MLFCIVCNLNTHIKTKHDNVSLSFPCYLCRKNFTKQEKYLRHIEHHKEGLNYPLYKKAFDGAVQIFRKRFRNYFSLTDILNKSDDIRKLIETQLLTYPKYISFSFS